MKFQKRCIGEHIERRGDFIRHVRLYRVNGLMLEVSAAMMFDVPYEGDVAQHTAVFVLFDLERFSKTPIGEFDGFDHEKALVEAGFFEP